MGHTFSDAFEQLTLEGDVPGVLDRVEILGGDGYFELAGVKVAGPSRKIGSIQMGKRYPPRHPILGPLADGSGAALAAGDFGSLLIVGMKVTRPGIGRRDGIRVYYSVDGKQYYKDHPAAVVNCPESTPIARCRVALQKGIEAASAIAD